MKVVVYKLPFRVGSHPVSCIFLTIWLFSALLSVYCCLPEIETSDYQLCFKLNTNICSRTYLKQINVPEHASKSQISYSGRLPIAIIFNTYNFINERYKSYIFLINAKLYLVVFKKSPEFLKSVNIIIVEVIQSLLHEVSENV